MADGEGILSEPSFAGAIESGSDSESVSSGARSPKSAVRTRRFCGGTKMNLRYLGDALDHWKGSLFEYLQTACLVRELAVDAMAGDAEQWQPADWKLFARLLRVKET